MTETAKPGITLEQKSSKPSREISEPIETLQNSLRKLQERLVTASATFKVEKYQAKRKGYPDNNFPSISPLVDLDHFAFTSQLISSILGELSIQLGPVPDIKTIDSIESSEPNEAPLREVLLKMIKSFSAYNRAVPSSVHLKDQGVIVTSESITLQPYEEEAVTFEVQEFLRIVEKVIAEMERFNQQFPKT